MYGNKLDDLAKLVAEKREENLKFEHARLTADEKDVLLKEYHPDRIASQFTELKIGPNKGQKAPIELAEMLQAKWRGCGVLVSAKWLKDMCQIICIPPGGTRDPMTLLSCYS